MIHIIERPYVILRHTVDEEYEGKMVVLAHDTSDNVNSGLLIAHSDGNPITENDDRMALLAVLREKCAGKGRLVSGYKYDGSELATQSPKSEDYNGKIV